MVAIKDLSSANHVRHWNALGDGTNHFHSSRRGFQNAICGEGWGDEQHRSGGAGRFHGIGDGVEKWASHWRLAGHLFRE